MLTASDNFSDIFSAIGFFFLLSWVLAMHATVTHNGENAHDLVVLYGWIPAAIGFVLAFAAWYAHVRISLKKGLGRPLYGGGFA